VTLKLVARHADGCNLGGDHDTLRHKLDVLRGHCEAAGTDYARIVKSIELNAIVGDDAEVARVVADTARRTSTDPEAVRSRFGPFVGRPERIAEEIQGLVDVGLDYVIVYLPNMAEGGVIQSFAAEVMALLNPATAL
jgi:alkanesulfonate monooxygenase SsuD/methylene tetrahydromethanopterin reductase-like flavin-dependent oxidoreductase (luciferase family)